MIYITHKSVLDARRSRHLFRVEREVQEGDPGFSFPLLRCLPPLRYTTREAQGYPNLGMGRRTPYL